MDSQAIDEALASIDAERYLELLQQLLGPGVDCALYRENTLLAATSNFTLSEAAQPNTVCHELKDHLKNTIANLWVRGTSNSGSLNSAVSQIAGLIEHEIQLTSDLNALSDELTKRYEDLNLVFDSQEITSGLVDFGSGLEQLVNSTMLRQHQGAVVLLIPSKNIEIQAVQHAQGIVDIDAVLDMNRSAWWSFLKQYQNQWVHNIDTELDLVSKHNCKLLLSPIALPHGELLGSLCMLRPANLANFSNSDRNMAEVLCQNTQSIFNASFDLLTGLTHRSAFEKTVNERITAQRNQQQAVDSLLLVNVDRTQVINDSLGRAHGDLLIQQVANKLEQKLRRGDTVSRLGSDEFAILLQDSGLSDANRIANGICRAVQEIRLQKTPKSSAFEGLQASVSIGVNSLDPNVSITNTLSRAEVACAKAKELGGNQVQVFHSSNEELTSRREQMLLVHTIQDALAKDNFSLYGQPIVNLRNVNQPPHFEVLLRLESKTEGTISPGLFLPAAERYSLMPQIDRWVVKHALQTLDDSNFLVIEPDTVCAINLSGQTLSDEQFADFVLAQMEQVQVKPNNVCFEITETTAINDFALAQTFIDEMKSRGFLFSLDDFGTGLSSFTYLQRMPVNYLKIDGSFVARILTDPISHAMVKAIADVATAMDLCTIAEFVETQAIQDELAAMDIHYGQGYHFSKPKPLAQYFAAYFEQAETNQASLQP